MKILYLVPYAPTTIRTRPYNLARSLARHGHQVILATVWENEAELQMLEEFRRDGIEVLAQPLNRGRILQNLVVALVTCKPLQATYSWQPELAKMIVDKLHNNHLLCDIIHIEHLRGAIYGLKLAPALKTLPAKIPVVWDSVDNITLLFEQAAGQHGVGRSRRVAQLELPRTRRYERLLCNRFDRLLVTSPADQAAFLDIAPSGQSVPAIEVLTNGVDLQAFSPAPGARQDDTIVFSGKLSYHANISAARFLVTRVMPLVWAHRPQARLQLVGKDPHPSLRQIAQAEPRVEVTGTVPDISIFLRQASAAAATLTYGAGVQNKVLEAMACATPVVTTSKALSAIAAIPGEELLVGDEPETLAGHLLDLLEDPALRQRIGENGRQYVERCHDWNKIALQLVSIYEDVIRTGHSPNHLG
jgi:glycosyltransferase involved in cell wall biosynthesis